MYRAYRATPASFAAARTWSWRFIAASAATGVVWGALGVLFLPRAGPTQQLLIVFCVGGMIAGAVATNSFVRAAYYGFAVPAILPVGYCLFTQQAAIFYWMAVLLVIFASAMFTAAYRFHQAVTANLRGKHQVANLAGELRRAKVTLEANNQALDRLLAENRLMVDTASTGIAFIRQGTIAHCNRRFEALFGYAPGELLGKPAADIHLCDPTQRDREIAERAMRAGEVYEQDVLVTRKDGSTFWCHRAGRYYDPADPRQGTIWDYADVDERKRLEDRARHYAQHDPLTELPNRLLLMDRLMQGINRARRSLKRLGVLFVDLDGFKALNDSLGHAAGDQLLQAIAKHLEDCVRHEDTVCRHGGDEFVVLLTEISTAADAENVARKILAAIATPIDLEGRHVKMSASIGVALFPDHGDEADALIKQADLAMYQAKQMGRNRFQFCRGTDGRVTERVRPLS
jgi:diguanylate cyclase (GGDEF)-like protein/PAS domain S-box-containing protein